MPIYHEVFEGNTGETKTRLPTIQKVLKRYPVKRVVLVADLFDQACSGFDIEHRLIPPRHPQTNGMVERFNGRISQGVKTTHFANAEEITRILNQYMKTYSHHIVQRNLDHLNRSKR